MAVPKEVTLVLDLLWSFFIAALNSYRYDSILRPYPQKYINPDTKEKDVQQLRQVASVIPSVPEVLDQQETIPPEPLELFNWVVTSPNFKLSYENFSVFQRIKELTEQVLPAAEPNHVFKVVHSENHELKFQKRKELSGSFYAYHGSRLENFYSILKNGLLSHLNKNGIFGTGTYFSTELRVSLHYSFSSKNWKRSLLGSTLSCVAVCEIIKDPSIKYNVTGTHRALSYDIIDEKIPEKYFVVSNNELVILRYLLAYTSGCSQSRHTASSWWRKHIFGLFVSCYLLVLVALILSR